MTNKQFYTLVLPENAETKGRQQGQRNVSKQGSISQGSGITQSISLNPNERLLTGWFRGTLAKEMADEFEQLFGASGIDVIPIYGQDEEIREQGYFTTENVTVNPPEPRRAEVQMFDGRIVKKGTSESHYRSIETNVVQVDNDFGNVESADIGVPSAATNVRWFDKQTKNRESVTTTATRTLERADIDIVDVNDSSYDSPTLIYDLDYQDEGDVDTIVWDDRGKSKTTTATVDGVDDSYVQWMRIFDPRHVFSGTPILESGSLRLELDSPMSAYRWDGSTYSSVSLGTSDWELSTYDIVFIGDEKLRVQLDFYDSVNDSYYTLDALIRRGMDNVQFTVPKEETPPTPSGLVTLLDPIASDRVLSAQETKTVLDKNEVRK